MIKRPIVVIAGCTASGKSDIAIKLAKEIGGVIINADSRQVYREISIGTAKPIAESMEGDILIVDGIKHYLYSYISVKEDYNLYRYQQDVFALLEKFPEDVVPILVGGTGLYIDSVVYNYKLKKEQQSNEDVNLDSLSIEDLQKLVGEEKLKELNESDKQNPRRLTHILKHGLPSIEKGEPLNHLYFFLDIEGDEIKENVRLRVDRMIANVLIEENERIRKEKLSTYPALNTIGYREFDEYFKGEKTIDEVKEEIITHTNQYVKRQRTWFRRNRDIIYAKDFKTILDSCNTYLHGI